MGIGVLFVLAVKKVDKDDCKAFPPKSEGPGLRLKSSGESV